MNAVHPLVRDQLLAKDAMTFELGDALDTKASIALVVITFLGTQTAWFVTDRHVAGTWLLVKPRAARMARTSAYLRGGQPLGMLRDAACLLERLD